MFDNLQDKLERAMKTLKGQGQITDVNVAATVKEIRRALLDADVNYKIAKDFTDKVQKDAMGQGVLTSVTPGQLLTKIVSDELTKLMGGQVSELHMTGSPSIILMAGLQGSGKTTHSGKLAALIKSKGRQPLIIAADVYRPAAVDQLKTLGEQIGVEVYAEPGATDAVGIAQRGLAHAKQKGFKVVIVDTAGRLSVDEKMMAEIAELKRALNPQEILFVVDAMTGQDAVNTAVAFNERLDYTGVILTKLDGDTKGGAAISISYAVGKPIKFIGTGEKMNALDIFYPDRMAQRILGMGDVISLVERAQQQFDEEEAKKLQKKMGKGTFDFEDFMNQIRQIKKMGNLKDLLGMIPGVGKQIKDLDIDDGAFKEIEAMIQSMTIAERKNPELLSKSKTRQARIAKGSGTDTVKLTQMLKQFEEMRKMMKNMGQMQEMMKKLGPMGKMSANMPGGMPAGMPNLPGGMKLPGGLGGASGGLKLPSGKK